MRSRLGLGLVLVGLLVVLSGCDEEKVKSEIDSKYALAQRQLQEVRELGAPMRAKSTYELAEQRYYAGRASVDSKKYIDAAKAWEDFELLIIHVRNEVLASRRLEEDNLSKLKAELSAQEQRPTVITPDVPVVIEPVVVQAPVVVPPVIVAPVVVAPKVPTPVVKVIQPPVVVVAPLVVPATYGDYVVKRGDHLWQISRRYYKTKDRWVDIYRANRRVIKNPERISPGQKLVIPRP